MCQVLYLTIGFFHCKIVGEMRGALCFLVFTGLTALAQPSIPLGLDAFLPAPEDNPVTAAKAALGRRLFFEPALSRDGKVSCASCHDPDRAFTDDRPLAIGVSGKRGTRRVPSIVNRGYGRAFFWDGRIATLEEQVLQPIQNPVEMDLTIPQALEAVAKTGKYPPLDERALSHALATYVRTILSGDAPYDRYIAGDRAALSPEALAGLRLFRGKANCTACHIGPNLTDEQFHNTGIGFRDGKFTDEGRQSVTQRGSEAGAFKTPTLRDVARRPPYMHDGSLAMLADVIEHYDKGGVKNPNLSREIQPLKLTPEEKRQLEAFLRSLNGKLQEGF
jgi:cytochrome c peroxidase